MISIIIVEKFLSRPFNW